MLPLADPQRFVGRHRQLVALHEALESRSRLVTLHGPSGVGKSRLASEHLHAVRSERRVLAIDLEDAVTFHDALSLVASAVGAPSAAGRDPVSVLVDALRALGPTTLVLDHVDDVAESLASPISRWLVGCPETHLVTTSLRPLALPDEHACTVEPLALPTDASERVPSDAMRLWHVLRGGDSPRRERSNDAELVQLLRAGSGLPLLVELLAAQAHNLTPFALLERLAPKLRELGASPGPDAVLRAVLDAVWAGAGEPERAAFAQCAVFASSFDAEAFRAVYAPLRGRGTELTPEVALERLTQRRLLSRVYTTDGTTRYGMHRAVRTYAAERLSRLDRDNATASRHARYYVGRGSELSEAIEGREGPEATRSLLRDHGNLLRVLQRPARDELEDATLRLRALCVHDQILSTYGPAETDLERLDAALSAAAALGVDLSVRTEAHCVRAFVHARRGAMEKSALDLARAEELTSSEERRHTYDAGRVAVTVAFIKLSLGDLAEADRQAVRALDIAERASHKKLAGIALGIHALIRRVQGNEAEARALYERALAIHRELGNLRFEGIVETRLAQLLLDKGDAAQALAAEEHARSIHRTFGDRFMEGLCLNVRGTVLCAEGRLEEARAAFELAYPLLAAAGDQREATRSLAWQARVRTELGDYDLGLSVLAEARRGYEQLGNEREAKLATARLAGLEALLGDVASAQAKLSALEAGAGGDVLAAQIDIERAHLDFAELRAARSTGDSDLARRARERAVSRRDALERALAQAGAELRFPVLVDARASLRMFDVWLAAHEHQSAPTLKLSLAGRWAEAPRGERIDASNRPALRRILTRLAMHAVRAPGVPHTALELFAAGWPREHPGEENARLQVYAVLGTLRKLGLGEVLVADDRGHLLRSDVCIELVA